MRVLEVAQQLTKTSEGAFDVTVGELVALWGFGSAPPEAAATDARPRPNAEQIAVTLARTGFAAIELDPGLPAVRMLEPRSIDLSALAKGRAVDEIVLLLQGLGCNDLLVDIGGEIRVLGRNSQGHPWRLAIEQPGGLAEGAAALPTLALTSGSVATSGDYRNYRAFDGQRYSHLIDPRSGLPIEHGLASVTVWHAEAMWADGYATLLSVLGPQQGQVLAKQAKLAVAMLIRGADGFLTWQSPEFRRRFSGTDNKAQN